VQAGEIWHNLVLYAIERGWGGIENLALIPGTVGAAPIQNIGAYGVEARETILRVTGWHWQRQDFVTYENEACRFGYRDSIFKHSEKDKMLITSVLFQLNKRPRFNTSYGAIEQELEAMGVKDLSVSSIAQAVINIRRSKLPDPAVIGNAGSFFKNPVIPIAIFAQLKEQYPQMPSFPAPQGSIKIPAAWLIEQCGWKGYRNGDTGVHAQQALVLVNYGTAQGADIWRISGEIVASVKEKFGVDLEREVQVW
jgi:UDP-N-acetylmuramate dehydrogenase